MTETEWNDATARAEAHLAQMRESMSREKNWTSQEDNWKDEQWHRRFLKIAAVLGGLFIVLRFLPEIIEAWKPLMQ